MQPWQTDDAESTAAPQDTYAANGRGEGSDKGHSRATLLGRRLVESPTRCISSSLEAKWAAYFDRLGWKHQYHPIVFITEGIPSWAVDFWLPTLRFYVEVKPIYGLDADQGTRKKMVDVVNGGLTDDGLCLLGNGPIGWLNVGRVSGAVRLFHIDDFEPISSSDDAASRSRIERRWDQAVEDVQREGIDWRPPNHPSFDCPFEADVPPG